MNMKVRGSDDGTSDSIEGRWRRQTPSTWCHPEPAQREL